MRMRKSRLSNDEIPAQDIVYPQCVECESTHLEVYYTSTYDGRILCPKCFREETGLEPGY